MRNLLTILFGIGLVAAGMAAGWWLSGMKAAQSAAPSDPHAGHGHAADAHGEDDHAEDHLSAATLKTLGIRVGPAVLSAFETSIRVPSIAVDRPENFRGLHAPLSGTVREVHVKVGDLIGAETLLVTIERDPIPRFTNERTAPLLTPINEKVHEAVAALRKAKTQASIATDELARLQRVSGGDTALLPAKRRIEMEYELRRANQEVASAEYELAHHGLSKAEVTAIHAGEHPPAATQLWQRMLKRSGMWTARADALRQALPESDRSRPWVIAGIGELEAAGKLSPALIEAVGRSPAIVKHFGESVSLLLKGTTVVSLERWARLGALADQYTLKVPEGGTVVWDVDQIAVRVGDRATQGEELLRLHDAATMWLRAEPVGSQLTAVTSAFADDLQVRAMPLVPGSGPELTELRIRRIHGTEDDPPRSAAFIEIKNEGIECCAPTVRGRSWQIRAGLRYVLHVPQHTLSERFVLPVSALVREGPNALVFIANGDDFREVTVHVEHEDEDHVVIANDGSIFPGDPVVMENAFALSVALQQLDGGGDAGHHGHAH